MTAATRDVSWADVSVIICTKDRPTELARAIASIRDSGPAGRSAEIVVVEEGGGPQQIPGVRSIRLPQAGRGFGHARNAGLSAVDADLVLFMDDDCEAERGWIEALTAPFRRDESILGVAGPVLVRDCGLIGYAENVLGFPGGGLRYLDEAHGRVVPTRHLSTCNCAYRRQALEQIGGFPEAARAGAEDSLVAERIAGRGPCVYVPTAVVYHRARGRLPDIFRWFVRRGRSEVGFLQMTAHPWQSVSYLIRSSWTPRLLLLGGVLTAWPRTAIFLPPMILVYYGMLLWRFRFARRYPTHRRAWWLVPAVKCVMDAGLEVGRWQALLGLRRSH